MRSIAEQTDEELGGAGSVFARQRRDHVELDGLLRRIRATSGEEQQAVLGEMCRLVFSHAFAEEAVVWPALRRGLPDGEARALEGGRGHQGDNETAAAG